MKVLTASSTARALSPCTYWLRDDVPLPEVVENDAMRAGTAVHEQIERSWRDEEPFTDPRVGAALEWIRSLGNIPIALEQAYGIEAHGKFAVALGTGRAAYASMPRGKIFGTADVVAKTSASEWLIVDWKTGSGQAAEKARPQLELLAALVLSTSGGGAARLVAVHLTDDGRAITHEHGTIGAWEADELLERLLTMAPASLPFPGEHCHATYCPLEGQCPAYQTAVALVPVEQSLVRNPLVTGIETDADIEAAIPLLELVEGRVEHLKKQLRTRIETMHGGAFRLSDGRVYKRSEGSRNYAHGESAMALAERLGATPDELAQCLKKTKFPIWRMGK